MSIKNAVHHRTRLAPVAASNTNALWQASRRSRHRSAPGSPSQRERAAKHPPNACAQHNTYARWSSVSVASQQMSMHIVIRRSCSVRRASSAPATSSSRQCTLTSASIRCARCTTHAPSLVFSIRVTRSVRHGADDSLPADLRNVVSTRRIDARRRHRPCQGQHGRIDRVVDRDGDVDGEGRLACHPSPPFKVRGRRFRCLKGARRGLLGLCTHTPRNSRASVAVAAVGWSTAAHSCTEDCATDAGNSLAACACWTGNAALRPVKKKRRARPKRRWPHISHGNTIRRVDGRTDRGGRAGFAARAVRGHERAAWPPRGPTCGRRPGGCNAAGDALAQLPCGLSDHRGNAYRGDGQGGRGGRRRWEDDASEGLRPRVRPAPGQPRLERHLGSTQGRVQLDAAAVVGEERGAQGGRFVQRVGRLGMLYSSRVVCRLRPRPVSLAQSTLRCWRMRGPRTLAGADAATTTRFRWTRYRKQSCRTTAGVEPAAAAPVVEVSRSATSTASGWAS